MLKKILFTSLTFLGWILSPFTWWNDAFVNLPLAYLATGLFGKLFPGKFLITFLAFYWFTNFLGIVLMYVGSILLRRSGGKQRYGYAGTIGGVLVAVIVYSIISGVLIGFKIIRPF